MSLMSLGRGSSPSGLCFDIHLALTNDQMQLVVWHDPILWYWYSMVVTGTVLVLSLKRAELVLISGGKARNRNLGNRRHRVPESVFPPIASFALIAGPRYPSGKVQKGEILKYINFCGLCFNKNRF